jgi:hypothetical protein
VLGGRALVTGTGTETGVAADRGLILSPLTFFLICIGAVLIAVALLLAVPNEKVPVFPAKPAEEDGKLNPTAVTPSFPCEVVAEDEAAEEEEEGPALSMSSSSFERRVRGSGIGGRRVWREIGRKRRERWRKWRWRTEGGRGRRVRGRV